MQHQDIVDLFRGYRLGALLGSGGEGSVFAVSSDGSAAGVDGSTKPLALKVGHAGDHAAIIASLSSPGDSGRFPAKALIYHTGNNSYETVPEWHIPEVLWLQYQRLMLYRTTLLLPKPIEFGMRQGVPWYVMERLEGADMRSVMHSSDFSSGTGIRLLRQLLEQMLAAQKVQSLFWHGDLKPENIIVGADGRCRLIDPAITFGAYRMARTLTVQYNPLGLESQQADTFSIATIAVEILTGEQPFREIRFPLMLGPPRRLTQAEQRSAIEHHLDLDRATLALPKRLRGLVSSWFLHSPTYDEMLQQWPDLESTTPAPEKWYCIFCGWKCDEDFNEYLCKQCDHMRVFTRGSATLMQCRSCEGFSLAVAKYCEWCGECFA